MNPNITFTIGDSVNRGPTVEIALPYASFDLQAAPPAAAQGSRFFPLRRAANKTQYTLGRTFFQEAYVNDLFPVLSPKLLTDIVGILSQTTRDPIFPCLNQAFRMGAQ